VIVTSAVSQCTGTRVQFTTIKTRDVTDKETRIAVV